METGLATRLATLRVLECSAGPNHMLGNQTTAWRSRFAVLSTLCVQPAGPPHRLAPMHQCQRHIYPIQLLSFTFSSRMQEPNGNLSSCHGALWANRDAARNHLLLGDGGLYRDDVEQGSSGWNAGARIVVTALQAGKHAIPLPRFVDFCLFDVVGTAPGW